MEVKKEAFISCELAGETIRATVKGDLEDILPLAAYLMTKVATSVAKVGLVGLDDPRVIIYAMAESAMDVLKEMD